MLCFKFHLFYFVKYLPIFLESSSQPGPYNRHISLICMHERLKYNYGLGYRMEYHPNRMRE